MAEIPQPQESQVPQQPKESQESTESKEAKGNREAKENQESQAQPSPPPANRPPTNRPPANRPPANRPRARGNQAASDKPVQSAQAAPQPQDAALKPSESSAPVAAAPAAAATSDRPSIAATLDVPPVDASLSPSTAVGTEEAAGGDGGGEWNLLVGKVKEWFVSDELRKQWESLQGPLRGLGILIAVVLTLRVYGSLVRTIEGIPVVSGLLELAGLIYVVRFSLKNLSRATEREELMATWSRRWEEFLGKL